MDWTGWGLTLNVCSVKATAYSCLAGTPIGEVTSVSFKMELHTTLPRYVWVAGTHDLTNSSTHQTWCVLAKALLHILQVTQAHMSAH